MEDDYDEETDVEEEQTSISKEDEAILKEGGVIGIIEIPGLDIRYPVMEGTTSKVLNAGIGHIEELSLIHIFFIRICQRMMMCQRSCRMISFTRCMRISERLKKTVFTTGWKMESTMRALRKDR